MTTSKPTFALMTLLVACTGGGGSGGDTTVEGGATYRDAATNHDGTTRKASAPPSQDIKVRVIVKGTGQIPNVDPQCALDPAGHFEARYVGNAALSEDGAYLSSFGESAASIVTPSGCKIPDLTVGVVTDVIVRGELTVTTQNCDTYCESSARAEAEAMCGATPNAAQCRASAETQATARCKTTCTSQANKIAAEVSLGASAIGSADADMLRAAALGDLQANLKFDRMEDANGRVLQP